MGCQKFNTFHFPLIVVSHVLTFADQPRAPGRRIPLPEGSSPCQTYQPALSPDGSQMATMHSGCFARGSGGVLVAAATGANPVEFPGRDCQHMEWRADGQAIYCAEDNNLLLLTLPDRKASGVLSFAKTVEFNMFSFSNDGRWLVAELVENEFAHFYLVDLQATPLGPGADFKKLTDIPRDRWPSF